MRAAGYLRADYGTVVGQVKISDKFDKQPAEVKRAILTDWLAALEAIYEKVLRPTLVVAPPVTFPPEPQPANANSTGTPVVNGTITTSSIPEV